MGKTKAEFVAENRELKKELLKLQNFKEQAMKRLGEYAEKNQYLQADVTDLVDANEAIETSYKDLEKQFDALQKEKTLIQAQRDNLLLEYEKMAEECNNIQNDLEILQSQLKTIKINEEMVYDQGYDAGFKEAKDHYKSRLEAVSNELDAWIERDALNSWLIRSLHKLENPEFYENMG